MGWFSRNNEQPTQQFGAPSQYGAMSGGMGLWNAKWYDGRHGRRHGWRNGSDADADDGAESYDATDGK